MVPFSTRRPRRALSAGGGQPPRGTIPLRRSRRLSARAFTRTLRSAAFALAVFRFSGEMVVASPDPADIRGGSFDRRQRVARRRCGHRSRIRRSRRRDSRRLPVRRAGEIGETDSSFLTLVTDPSGLALRRENLAARAGSCTDASFGAVFRYPLGALRGLAGREVLPSLLVTRAAAFRPRRITCLVRRRSWGSTLRRFAPTSGWSRRANYAAAESLGNDLAAAFLSDRAHVPFLPAHPRVPIYFRRDDRPPVRGKVS